MRRLVRRYLSPRMRRRLRLAAYLPLDAADVLLGRRPPLVPPRRLMFDSSRRLPAQFLEDSRTTLGYLTGLCGLTRDASLLDVGSGIGRNAVALADYLSPAGRYEGIDIVREGVDWCRGSISARYPNFRFTHVDLYNGLYNPGGTVRSARYTYPFEEGGFDVVLVGSVFTHMLPEDVAHYLAEIRRVLKPGGRAMITYFLLNAESRDLIAAGRSTQPFVHPVEGVLTTNPATPEDAVCYPEEQVRALYRETGLTIAEPIRYGSWPGRRESFSYQDIIIGVR